MKKVKHGKEVYNKFLRYDHYSTRDFFEEAVEETVKYLKKAHWLYRDQKTGIIKVFRNKNGARIIAYDLP